MMSCSCIGEISFVDLGGSLRNGREPVHAVGRRGKAVSAQNPTGRNEDEPHRMSRRYVQQNAGLDARPIAAVAVAQAHCSKARGAIIPNSRDR